MLSVVHTLNAEEPKGVGIYEVLKFPQKFDGAHVTVIGYLKLSHRGPMLFRSKDEADKLSIVNMIPLQPSASSH